MKHLLVLSCFMIFLGCAWKKESEIRFGYKVVFSPLEGYTHCTGNVRNYLGFDRYQLDDVWCEYETENSTGAKDPGTQIVAEKDMKVLYWQETGMIGPTYTPVTGSGSVPDIKACHKPLPDGKYKNTCNYKKYMRRFGKWVNSETGVRADMEKDEDSDGQESLTGFMKI